MHSLTFDSSSSTAEARSTSGVDKARGVEFSGSTLLLQNTMREVSDRPARTPRVVLAVASHDSLTVRFLI